MLACIGSLVHVHNLSASELADFDPLPHATGCWEGNSYVFSTTLSFKTLPLVKRSRKTAAETSTPPPPQKKNNNTQQQQTNNNILLFKTSLQTRWPELLL